MKAMQSKTTYDETLNFNPKKDTNLLNSFLLQLTSDLIYCLDTSKRIIKVNTAFCKLLQLKEEAINGKTYYELGFPENLCRQWDDIITNIIAGETIPSSYFEGTLTNGNLFSYNLNFHAIPSDDGHTIGVAIIANNIVHQQEELIAERTLL